MDTQMLARSIGLICCYNINVIRKLEGILVVVK